MTALGPFEIGPEQVARLGGGFTTLINRLLASEVQRAGMLQHQLLIDDQGPVPDGGVDARLDATRETSWLPGGASAWQFKSGDLPPAKCRKELKGASWARELLEAGATYILVLGEPLTPQKVVTRKQALLMEAAELKLPTDPDRYRVYDANKLAAWISQFPGLAVHQLLGGHGAGAHTFERWSSSQLHQTTWTPSSGREADVRQILEGLDVQGPLGLRISGVSGVGKTRLAMEALRGSAWEPLVAYVPAYDQMPPALLPHAVDPGRTVLLVVDECDARQHEKLIERIPASSTVRVITIGTDGATPLSARLLRPEPLPAEAMEDFLKRNAPTSTEARRFVVTHAEGNPRFALLIAERLQLEPEATAADLIRRDDIETITGALLPEGSAFFVAAVLALFERVGWDRELQTDKDVLAAFAGVTTQVLDVVAADLEERGLLVRQGRYRAVGPHPVAVLLAARAWRQYADRIVTELLPQLTQELTLALLSRVSDLGSYPPARDSLRQLLTSAELASLDSIETGDWAPLLMPLAVVLPDELSDQLHRLLIEASPEQVRQQVRSRRQLVWTLEKLVWHSRLFEQAADSILQLALAENERYANNASGLWTSLFGAALPPTAAPPAARLAYLRRMGSSSNRAVLRLAVAAAEAALHPHESVLLSGELQGGTPVEPRGGVSTQQEADEYRADLVAFLAEQYQRAEGDAELATQAANALIGALHPLVDLPASGAALRVALSDLRPAELPLLRKSIAELRNLFRDHPKPAVEAGLDAVEAGLPVMGPLDVVRTLTDLDPWTFEDEQRYDELRGALRQLYDDGQLGSVLIWLTDRTVNGGWHLGRALASTATGELAVQALQGGLELNVAAAAGYLAGRLELGETTVASEFFGSDNVKSLPSSDLLGLAVRLPPTSENRERVLALLDEVSPHDGAVRLFGWQRHFDAEEAADLLARWLPRIADQDDYRAVVDWIAGWFHRRTDLPGVLAAAVRELVLARPAYPDLGQQALDWARLSGLIPGQTASDLTAQVIHLVDRGLLLQPDTPEGRLLVQIAKSDPETVWRLVGEELKQDNWRLSMSIRGWLTSSIPVDVLRDWVGGRGDRAQQLAGVASAGEEEPSQVALYLLTEFGDDERVRSALSAEFVSGGWTGRWSERIKHQIDLLSRWDQPSSPTGVRSWAQAMRRQLEADLAETLEHEAERGY